MNIKVYSPLFKPLIIYSSKKKSSAHYICVCFWSCTERSNFLCVSNKGYTRARAALPDFPAKELLSRIAKKIFTMRVPTKLTRVFPEDINKLMMCPGLFWCWLYGTGLLVYFIFIEGKCNWEELWGFNTWKPNLSIWTGWSSSLLWRDQAEPVWVNQYQGYKKKKSLR